jgi:hypothetical protein
MCISLFSSKMYLVIYETNWFSSIKNQYYDVRLVGSGDVWPIKSLITFLLLTYHRKYAQDISQ